MTTFKEIREWGKDSGIDFDLLYSIAVTESSLNPLAVSKAGAQGLFQFMPITQKDLADRFGYPFDPFCPRCSTIAAGKYLKWLMDHFDSLDQVLGAWNWGYGNMKAFLRGEKTMPSETKNFIRKVKTKLENLKE